MRGEGEDVGRGGGGGWSGARRLDAGRAIHHEGGGRTKSGDGGERSSVGSQECRGGVCGCGRESTMEDGMEWMMFPSRSNDKSKTRVCGYGLSLPLAVRNAGAPGGRAAVGRTGGRQQRMRGPFGQRGGVMTARRREIGAVFTTTVTGETGRDKREWRWMME